MRGIHIVGTGRALPEKILTNEDMSRLVDTSDEWIVTRTGIRQRHICGQETCASLASEAAKKALQEAAEKEQVRPEEIGAVVVATATSDYDFPSTACLVQKELGLSSETMAFDLAAACSGFLYGLEVCRGLLTDSRKKYVLLIGSEQLSKITDYTDRQTCILFGDGAGAAVLRLDDSLYVHRAWSRGSSESLYCEGVGTDGAKLKMDGSEVFRFAAAVLRLDDSLYVHRAWSRGSSESLYCEGVGTDGAKLKMDGSEVFRFAVRAFTQGMEAVLMEAGVRLEEVDHVICHQANRRIIEHVMKKYPGQERKFYINIEHYGNTSAASIPIALDEMREKGMLKEGMRVLAVGFGAGFTWSGALFTI